MRQSSTVVRLVNNDSFFSDHGAYWGNYEEFVTRLVYEILEQDATALRMIDSAAIRAHRRKVGENQLSTPFGDRKRPDCSSRILGEKRPDHRRAATEAERGVLTWPTAGAF